MKKIIRHILSVFCAVTILMNARGSLQQASAQWEIIDHPEADWGIVQTLTELRCGNLRMVLAGTNTGVFLDQLGLSDGKTSPAPINAASKKERWLDISNGIPPALRDIRSIVTVDSTVFALSAYGGVYYATLRCGNIGQQLLWRPLNNGLAAQAFSTMLLHTFEQQTTLAVGSDNGVWVTTLQKGTPYKNLRWRAIEGLSAPVVSLHAEYNSIYASVHNAGILRHRLDCDNCAWAPFAVPHEFGLPKPVQSVFTMTSVQQDLQIPSSANPTSTAPCRGLLVSFQHSSKLLLGTRGTSESFSTEWVDLSPLLSNKNFQTTITAVATAKFTDAPPAILVGTESRGILYSDDCGMSWYELNDGADQSNFLGNAEVRALAANDNVVLAGVRSNLASERGGDISKGDPAKIANTIATLTPKSVVRAAQIAESSRRTANDSIKANRINVLMDAAAERGLVQLSVNESQPVEVAAYNILGKKVLDIYAGEARAGANSIPFDITQLSRGMYICVVRGKSFKLAEKFLISR